LRIEEFAKRYGGDALEARELLNLTTELEGLRPAPLPLELNDQASEIHFGPYRIVHEIGRGGFGIVFDAVEVNRPEKHVALKLVNPLVAASYVSQEALLDEARVLQGLVHPGIVRVLDCGRDRGFVWFAMQRIEGVHLDLLPALPAAQRHARALRLGLKLADAVGAAHAQAVIHRDLKPSNVIISDDGEVHILDFGLAIQDDISISVSHPGSAAGTPLFMAPEQFDPQGRVDRRTDIHALGYLLLLLASPEVRHDLLSSRRATRRLLGELRPLPRVVFRGLPAPLRVIIQRCLAAWPEDRYPSTGDLGDDLRAAANGQKLPHGRPSILQRTRRTLARHPLPTGATAAFITGATLAAWWFIWNAPVTTHIDCHLTGKRLFIDGELRGLTPFTTQLRPGVHSWKLQYGDGTDATYQGDLEVQRGEPNAFLFYLNPLAQHHWLDDTPYDEVPSGEGAWVRVATRQAGASLSGIPGRGPIPIDDTLCMLCPLAPTS